MAREEAPVNKAIEHIVVVMMENRSFDHMLGYLGKTQWRLGDPTDPGSVVEGLGDEEWTVGDSDDDRAPPWDGGGQEFKTFPLGTTKWDMPGFKDPPHSGKMVGWQVTKHWRYPWAYWRKHVDKNPGIDPGKVLGYLTRDEVPVYDFLAREYCVCDHWFCSVPGATWPNRMFAVAGTAGGETDIPETVLEGLWGKHTFFRELDRMGVSWRWYSSDPSLLRAFDGHYRTDDTDQDRFAYFNEYSDRQERNFLADVSAGELPCVSWVDPNFFKFPRGLDGPAEANDDHPPHDVMLGQKFINTVYETLRRSKCWDSTMLMITYDEHGGFYDHVTPPEPLGPRVPGLVVSPWVPRGRPFSTELEHTSIIKTILRRFADDRALETLGPRTYYANDLWGAVTLPAARTDCGPVTEPGGAAISDRDDLTPIKLKWPGSTLQRVVEIIDKHSARAGTAKSRKDLVELQEDLILLFEEMRRVTPRPISRNIARIARWLPRGLKIAIRALFERFVKKRKIPARHP